MNELINWQDGALNWSKRKPNNLSMHHETYGLSCFLYGTLKYNCIFCFVIFVNGVIYHGFSGHDKIVRILDVATNTVIGAYVCYMNVTARVYACLGLITYILNTKYIRSPFIHVYCVQFVLFLGLEQFLLA